jgi:hypothetical protein
LFPLLIFAGVAGAAIFFFGSDGGRRRRALFRDKAGKLGRRSARAVAGGARDLSNRAIGKAAGLRTSLVEDGVDDVVLEERVRARLGHVVEHAHSIHVTARNGYVTLEGSIQNGELNDAIATIEAVPGVYAVENRLTEAAGQSDGAPSDFPVWREDPDSVSNEEAAARAEPVGTRRRSRRDTGPEP